MLKSEVLPVFILCICFPLKCQSDILCNFFVSTVERYYRENLIVTIEVRISLEVNLCLSYKL